MGGPSASPPASKTAAAGFSLDLSLSMPAETIEASSHLVATESVAMTESSLPSVAEETPAEFEPSTSNSLTMEHTPTMNLSGSPVLDRSETASEFLSPTSPSTSGAINSHIRSPSLAPEIGLTASSSRSETQSASLSQSAALCLQDDATNYGERGRCAFEVTVEPGIESSVAGDGFRLEIPALAIAENLGSVNISVSEPRERSVPWPPAVDSQQGHEIEFLPSGLVFNESLVVSIKLGLSPAEAEDAIIAMYVTSDNGTTWELLEPGLPTGQYYNASDDTATGLLSHFSIVSAFVTTPDTQSNTHKAHTASPSATSSLSPQNLAPQGALNGGGVVQSETTSAMERNAAWLYPVVVGVPVALIGLCLVVQRRRKQANLVVSYEESKEKE